MASGSACDLIEFEPDVQVQPPQNLIFRLPRGFTLSEHDFSLSNDQLDFALLECDDEDARAAYMGKLQQDLRRGRKEIFFELAQIILDNKADVEMRSLALETMAGARARQFENETRKLILCCLNEPDHDLKFAAIAAASDLTSSNRRELKARIGFYETDTDMPKRIRRAANAFVKS